MVHCIDPCQNSHLSGHDRRTGNIPRTVDIRPVPDQNLNQFDRDFRFAFRDKCRESPTPCHRASRKSLRFCGKRHSGRNVHSVRRNGVCRMRRSGQFLFSCFAPPLFPERIFAWLFGISGSFYDFSRKTVIFSSENRGERKPPASRCSTPVFA